MMGVILLVIIVVVIVLTIVSKVVSDRKIPTIYFIGENKHYSISSKSGFIRWPFKLVLCGKSLRFYATFCQGCLYSTKRNHDINKLYGISYGFDNHYRSVRIGWRPSDNGTRIELYSYAYINGVRKIEYLCDIQQFEKVLFEIIKIDNNGVHITVNVQYGESDEHYFKRATYIVQGVDQSIIQFKQFPYFGGNKPAPDDVKIVIEEI